VININTKYTLYIFPILIILFFVGTASALPEVPVADFKATPTTGTAPLTVNFTDLSSNSPDSWLWDFGDGTNSTDQNPSHIYSIPETYTVKLTVSSSGGSDEEVKTSYIVPIDNTAPSVTASPNGGLYDHELDVTLSATDNVDTNPAIYYTTDNSVPNTNSTLYTAPIHIDKKTTLKFIAVDNAGNRAAVQTRIYNMDTVSLASYLFFKEHLVSGSVDGPLTNYQIKMNIHRGTGTDNGSDVYLDDYSMNWPNDIRFTDADNNILSYWTEQSNDSTAVVWVKVNSIPTSGTTIKLFYGNANSAEMSDGTNTFVAFEDFTNDTRRTSFWTENKDGGMSGYTDVHVFENGGYHIKQNSQSDRGAEIVMTNELSVPVWCNVFLKVVSESGGRTPPWTFNGVGYAASDWTFGYWGGVLGYDTSPGHTYKLSWTNAQTTNNLLLYENSKLLYSGSNSFSTTNKPDMGVRSASSEMGEWYFRNFYARTYTANEPVQGEWKSETPLQSFITRFSATPLIGIAPLTVQFTDQSVGNVTGWAWDFNNDGTTDSTEQNPVYTYNDSGVYNVKLSVTASEGNNTKIKTNYITADNQAPLVTANPTGKTYKTAQSVTLNASDNIDSLPVIYYTIDGTDPTTTSPTYTGPISITNTTTLKFMAMDDAGNQASIQTENYTIDKAVPTVMASPDGGLYNHEPDVVLSATDDVDTNPAIYYTTDGSIPTTNSTLYTAPVHITDKTILKFIAVDDAGNQATVQNRVYYVDTMPLTSYSFVKEHDITGSVDGPLTDYQIKMNIHRGTGTDNGSDVYLNDYSQNWPNDIRFTDADNSILSYWIEQSDDNTTVVWVEVNSIPTSGTTIKLYYGNANGTDMSDGTNTFVAFEDFADDTRRTSIWTENSGGASSYVSTHAFEKGGYHIQQSSSSSRGAGIVLTSPLGMPTVCTVTLNAVSETGSYTPPRIVTKTGYGSSEYLFGCWSGQVQGGYDTLPGHVYQIRWTDGSTANNVQLYENGNLLVTGNGDFSAGQHKPGMAVRTSSSMGEWYYKNFYARTYTANEPVQGEWKSENPLQSYIARFSATPLIGVAPLTVQFNDQSVGNMTGWAWDFNKDGTIDSTEQNPAYTYNDSGVYTVKLTISGPEGAKERVKTNYITADNLAPVVTANPSGKVYKVAQSVTLNVSDNIDSSPVIYYTTDGTDPTTASSTYTSSISIANTTTLKFMAIDVVGNQAPIQTENYTIDKVAPAVKASPDGGLYEHELDVTVSATDDVDTDPLIYYTTDGNTPSTNSTLYTAPIHITDKTILKFIAVDDVGNQAAVQTKVYYMETVPLKSYLLVKEHTIAGSVDGPLTDYQIKMNIHRGTGTDNGSDVYLDDYSLNWPNDIRFTDADNKALCYWIEQSDDNTAAVWVKVNTIPTSGTTIKLYYGNANSTDMSDGTNTFVAFENFADDTHRTSFWTENQDGGVSGYTDVHVFENNSYHIKQNSRSDRGAEIVMTNELGVPVWCNVFLEVVSESGGRSPPWTFNGIGYAASDWTFGYWGGVGGYDTSPGHTYKLSWTNAQTANNLLLYENNKQLYSGSKSFSTTNKPDMGVRTASQEMGEWYFRNFYARIYTANEPVQGEWGSEIHNLDAPPIASFIAAPIYGSPHTIQFTDKSINFPTGWAWDFGDGATSNEQNPVHTYAADGNYTVTLTATNEYGNDTEIKSNYEVVTLSTASITVSPSSVQLKQGETQPFTAVAVDQMGNVITNSSITWSSSNVTVGTIDVNGLFTALIPGTTKITAYSEGINASAEVTVIKTIPDLTVSVTSTNYPISYNTVTATIKNQGTGNVGLTTVNFMVDGSNTSINLTGLASGNTSTVSVTETVRRKPGDVIPIKVTVDPENTVAEANETNNEYTMNATIATNGDRWSGGRFSGGSDLVNTAVYQEGHVGVVCSVDGTGYGWFTSSGTVTYTPKDLPIPAGATIKSARLYQGWTWYGYPGFTVQFNGHSSQGPVASFSDNINGQDVFDVTPYFNASGSNTAVITAGRSQAGYYGTVLIVVYEANSEPNRQIWVNEGSDCLLYGTTDPHVSYTMINNVSTAGLTSVKLTTVLESRDGSDGTAATLNGQKLNYTGSGGSDPSFMYFDAINALQNGTNELGVNGSDSYTNYAASILVVTKETASEANFTANTTSGNAPLNVKFTDTSTGTPTGWTWDFGDGGTSNEQSPTHIYTTGGTYNVTLTVKTSLGNDSEEKTGYITVGSAVPAPVANFSSDLTSGKAPLTIQFKDESTNTPTSWAWDFGDGKSSTEQNSTHTYETVGTYTVKLTASNYGGSNSTAKTDYINVTSDVSAPIANFTTDANSGQVPFTVHFTDTSTGSVSSWKWDFGDSKTSTDQNPIHTYLTKSDYNVNLTVTGPGGRTTVTLPVNVSSPLASPSYNGGIPLTTVQNGTVSGGLWYDSYYAMETFAQKSFTLPAYSKIKWARLYIDVYDGHMENNYRGNVSIGIDANGDSTYEIQKQENFDTAYSFPGTGGIGPVWLSDHMNRVTSDYMMWYDLTDAISGQTVNVQAISTKVDSNFDGRIKAMTLVVVYDDGDSDQVYYWVNQGHDTVNPLDSEYIGSTSFGTSSLTSGWSSANLTAIYLASVDGVYAFNGTSLTSGVKSGPYYGSNTWDISSLLTAGQNSTLAYNKQESNYYKIPLAFMSVRYPAASPALPDAVFTSDVTSGTAPLTVNFTDQSTGSPTSWSWDFGDNTNSTEQNVSHTYTSAGTYAVNLTVSNGAGSDSEVKTDYITVSAQETQDTTKPVINSVVLFPANATAGSKISISVNASDNKEVTEVIAGDIKLTKTDGIWQGSITAPSAVGSYSLSINASDAAGNTAETLANYNIVQLSGSSSVSVSPKISSVAAGSNVSPALIVKNAQSIDDTFKVWISVSELPASSQANLIWFDWTEKSVKIRAGEEVTLPIEVNVPIGTAAGRKLFRVNVKSETTGISGFNTGYLTIA
jgi:PKD repeat protein